MHNYNFNGKTILLRADINVPIVDNVVQDTTRLKRLLPTIKHLLSCNTKIILISHLGRPTGPDQKFSLQQLVPELTKIFATKVNFSTNCIGEKVKQLIEKMNVGEILLLENLRFYPEEKQNDLNFAKELASLADVFVNDAFSCSHRAHASIVGIPKFIPSVAGFNFQNEIRHLSGLTSAEQKPISAIIGGSKISTKIPILSYLSKHVDFLIIGGGIANNFLIDQGFKIGNSLYEKGKEGLSTSILDVAYNHKCKVVVPEDVIVAKNINDIVGVVKSVDSVNNNEIILDIGPKTVATISEVLSKCKTVLWNGPLGAFEYKPFANGTNNVAKLIANLTSVNKITSVIGGGDVISAVKSAGFSEENFTYISTGGGAFLEFLTDKQLPGILALEKH